MVFKLNALLNIRNWFQEMLFSVPINISLHVTLLGQRKLPPYETF